MKGKTVTTRDTEWKWVDLPWNFDTRMPMVHALKRDGWTFVKTKRWGGGNQLFRRELKHGGFATPEIQADFEQWKKTHKIDNNRDMCRTVRDPVLRERCER